MALKIIIAGGGTGGHIFPAIAIANAIKQIQPEVDILFVGANGKMEMEKVPQAGYPIKGLDIAGFNRSSLLKNLALPFKLIKSFLQVKKIVNGFKPDAAIGVGGYSSFPVLRYAQQKNIPTFIHEANSFGGKANTLLAKRAVAVFTGSDGMEQFFPADKILQTGNPVRKSIVTSLVTRAEGLQRFNLSANKKTVLVTGGSLGAKTINEAIAANIDLFEENNVQLIWQTGRLFVDQAKRITNGKASVWTNDFITEMEYAYAAADVIISRAGAMSVAEMCIARKAVVFVPYPFAAEDHQTVNAQRLVAKNAALLIKDSLAKEALVSTTITLLNNDEELKKLSNNISELAITDADIVVATEVLKALKA